MSPKDLNALLCSKIKDVDTVFPSVYSAYSRLAQFHAQKLARKYPSVDADDVAQELMIHVYESLPNFDPERGNISQFVKGSINLKLRKLISEAKNDSRMRTVGNITDEAEDSSDDLFGQIPSSSDDVGLKELISDFTRTFPKLFQTFRELTRAFPDFTGSDHHSHDPQPQPQPQP